MIKSPGYQEFNTELILRTYKTQITRKILGPLFKDRYLWGNGDNYFWIFRHIRPSEGKGKILLEVGSRDALDAIALTTILDARQAFVIEPSHAGMRACLNNIADHADSSRDIVFLPFCAGAPANGLELDVFQEWSAKNHGELRINIGMSSLKTHAHQLSQHSCTEYDVPVVALDAVPSLTEQDVFLFCLDVEGSELEVLVGAKQLLKTVRYVCLESGYHSGRINYPSVASILDFMKKNGFSLLACSTTSSGEVPEDNGQMQMFDLLFQKDEQAKRISERIGPL